MLSDNVSVITKHYTETCSNEIEIEKSSEFISLSNKEDPRQHGIEVVFDYKSFMHVFRGDIDKVKEFIEENFLIDDIEIRLIELNQGEPKTVLCKSKPEMDEKAISLNKYFNGIEMNVVLKIVNEEVKKLEEITGADSESIFLYDQETNELISCNAMLMNLNDLIEGDKISYLQIPVIDSSISNRFENLISALDDWDEAYAKIENDISNYVYIFAKEFVDIAYTEGRIDKSELLIGDFAFDEFCDKFQSDKYNGTKVERINRIVSHKSNLDSIILINEKEQFGYDSYSWRYNKKDKVQKVYNKYVFLSKMGIVIPFVANMVNIGSATINLRRSDIVPNLARDNIDEKELQDSIGIALGKAIHLYLLENAELDEAQKELLNVFITKYYGEANKLIL